MSDNRFIDNLCGWMYKTGMHSTFEIIYAANELGLRIKNNPVAFGELPALLREAKGLHRRATEIALSLPQGEDRNFALGLREQMGGYETTIRKRFGPPQYAPGSGRN